MKSFSSVHQDVVLPASASSLEAVHADQPYLIATLKCKDGDTTVRRLANGKHLISTQPEPGIVIMRRTWETAYPLELIQEIHAIKGIYLCDEIMREEDPRYVEHFLRHEVLGYVDAAQFADKRVLDFGCGSGASTVILGRLLPPCDIVGIELEENLLAIARQRAKYSALQRVRFLQSPCEDALPAELGTFDYIMFNAVFEHLLPGERRVLLPKIWNLLNPGGILFLNQTPHRYAPIEIHTTGLPLINYLPDSLALLMARHFSRRVRPDDDWDTMLRAGIRGSTVREIMGILATYGSPTLLEPRNSVGDQIDLWYGRLSRRHAALKKMIWAALKVLKKTTGIELTPELALAIRKG